MSSKSLKLYCEQNSFYSNYLRCQRLAAHLPYKVTYFNEYDPTEAAKHDLCLFQGFYHYKQFNPKVKHIWDLDDVLENSETNTPDEIERMKIEMQRCFGSVDGVIFGSQGLYDRYKEWYTGKYLIMDDYLDPCDHVAINQPLNDGIVRIGFMGSGMYKQEVEELVPLMRELKKKYPIEFITIGVTQADTGEFPHIPYDRRYADFQYLLTSQHLDIAVIYQKPREVMVAKNYLKFAEFAWFGIPVVASGWITGKYVPNRYCKYFDDLNGAYKALQSLAMHKEERQKLGKLGQAWIKDHFSLHDRINTYINFMEGVL